MNGIRKQLAVCLTMLSLGIGAAEIPWFNQDFENREFFTPQAVKNGQSNSAGRHTGFALPHAKIVDLNGSQAFRLERIGSHRAFKFSGLTPMPEGRDFSVDFDVMLPEGGGTYIFLWDKDDRKLIGVSFHNNEVINITDEAELWVKLDITMPGGVSHFKFKGFICREGVVSNSCGKRK